MIKAKVFFTFLLCSIGIVITSVPLFSQSLQLDETLTKMPLGLYLEYFEDKDGKLTFDEIKKQVLGRKWIKSEKEKLAFGFTDSVYWVRFTIENPTDKEIEFYIEHAYPLVDSIQLYVPKGREHTKIEVGDRKPFSERPYKHKNFIFPLELKAKTSAVYYMRQQTGSSMQINLTVWSEETFRDDSYADYYVLMLFYGISFVMMFYNLVIYLFIRYNDYLYYSLNILLLLLFTSTQNGTAFQFLWPNYPVWGNFCLPPFIALYVMFGIFFITNALDLKGSAPILYKMGRLLALACIIGFVLGLFLTYNKAIVVVASIGLLATNYLFWIVVIMAVRKNRIAFFFLIALVFFLTCVLFWVLMLFGILPSNIFTNWAHYFGAVITETLFAIALADRINVMRVELQVLNTNLESRVTERTNELQAAMEELESMNQVLVETRDELWGEMELAKKIQTVLLPEKPEISGYEISAYMNPAEEVGGDYYDIINVGGYDWVIIGDVSGHGVPAGLIMMMAQTAINVTVAKNPDMSPSELLTIINKTVSKNILRLGGGKYMTMTVFAAFKDGKFHYSGLHQDILVYRKSQDKVELVETDGMWIGIVDDIDGMVNDDTLSLDVGDVMLLYTDGITEAIKNNGAEAGANNDFTQDMFGDKRLFNIFEKLGSSSVEEIKDGYLKELENYSCADDVTLVVLRRLH